MMLHVVNKSPFERNTLDSCLRTAKKGSSILLIEDGVFGALEGTMVSGRIKEAMADHKVYVLQPDLDARGVNGKLLDGIEAVDYGGFVDLAENHTTVQSWL